MTEGEIHLIGGSSGITINETRLVVVIRLRIALLLDLIGVEF